MKNRIKMCCFSILGVLVLGGSVSYAYSNATSVGIINEKEFDGDCVMLSNETEELPDGNIYIEELYEVIP